MFGKRRPRETLWFREVIFIQQHGGDRLEVLSAGTDPKGINPLTIAAMQEIGIVMDGHRSKSLGEYPGKITVNHVIVVSAQAENECPRVWPFALQRHFWPFYDETSDAVGKPRLFTKSSRLVHQTLKRDS